MLITMLGVGIFAGLKISRDAMVNELNTYIKDTNLYDFQLVSTLGFTEEDLEVFEALSGITQAEGNFNADVLFLYDGNEEALTLYTMPKIINVPQLLSGRLPQAANECVVCDKYFTDEDIGKTITVAESNADETMDYFKEKEYLITGIVQSSLYIGAYQGTTSIGSGSIYGFAYVLPEAINAEFFTSIYLSLDSEENVYSEEYKQAVSAEKSAVENLLEERVSVRYNELYGDLTNEMIEQMGLVIDEPKTYILTRSENTGYVSFESDTDIVAGISNIFPVFFFLIALLICITTMARMVEEERTQIGTLKALGYGSASIALKYIVYAGSASVLGWALGYFVGTLVIPKVIWAAYGVLYHFSSLTYIGSLPLALVTLIASVACSQIAVIFCCWRELSSVPAESMRPKPPKTGKRILLERIAFLWNRLSFLMKVSIRNVFRYKKRLLMMILGVSGCTALLIAGFGIKDSVQDVANYQYDEIMIFDMSVTLASADTRNDYDPQAEFLTQSGYKEEDCIFLNISSAEIVASDAAEVLSVYLSATDATDLSNFVHFQRNNHDLNLPDDGEALISAGIANKKNLSVEDSLTLKTSDNETLTFKVSGIFDNYVSNYIYISSNTYENILGKPYVPNHAYVLLGDNHDQQTETARLLELSSVSSVTLQDNQRDNINDSLTSIDYVVLMVVICAAALAFIVIYNLTNINIIERTREIATIKVLGFYPNESASYVLRENLILAGIGGILGLILGKYLHRLIMSMLVVTTVSFDVRVSTFSYLFSFLLTLIFALIVNLMMYGKLDRIPMADSLKTVE